MSAHAESERKPVWLRMWETLHGSVTVTTPEDWVRADAQLAALEEALARVDAEIAAVRGRGRDDRDPAD